MKYKHIVEGYFDSCQPDNNITLSKTKKQMKNQSILRFKELLNSDDAILYIKTRDTYPFKYESYKDSLIRDKEGWVNAFAGFLDEIIDTNINARDIQDLVQFIYCYIQTKDDNLDIFYLPKYSALINNVQILHNVSTEFFTHKFKKYPSIFRFDFTFSNFSSIDVNLTANNIDISILYNIQEMSESLQSLCDIIKIIKEDNNPKSNNEIDNYIFHYNSMLSNEYILPILNICDRINLSYEDLIRMCSIVYTNKEIRENLTAFTAEYFKTFPELKSELKSFCKELSTGLTAGLNVPVNVNLKIMEQFNYGRDPYEIYTI